MRGFRWLVVLTMVATLAVAPSPAQRVGGSIPHPSTDPGADSETDRAMRLGVEKERQKKRFEQMKQDSQKLLEPATALKKHVDESGEQVLSVEVIKKAEEMEKLARRVKENMRGR